MNDADGILNGRPFGGLAVLWRKNLGPACQVELVDDCRLMMCKLYNGPYTTALLNVYLPCDNGSNLVDYNFYLSKVDSVLDGFTYAAAIGDFNANITNPCHRFGTEFRTFCQRHNWIISDHVLAPDDTFTFFSAAHNTVAWLDHIISTTTLHSTFDKIWIDNAYITSDHFPIFASTNIMPQPDSEAPSHDNTEHCNFSLNWSKLSEADFSEYDVQSAKTLGNVHLNHSLILCRDASCKDPDHIAAIDTLYMQIIDALKTAEREVRASARAKTRTYQQVPGWKDLCLEQHQQARDAFHLWVHNGKPKTGQIFHLMKTTKANFKHTVRQCKLKENIKESDLLAHKFLKCKPSDFWKEIKKINGKHTKCSLPESVDGKTNLNDICNMWRDHFSNLLNSADNSDMHSVFDTINVCEIDAFTHDNILDAIKVLKSGKSSGKDGLRAEAFKHANKSIVVYLCIFFNAVICHGYIPRDLMDTIIVPIVKDKKGNLESKDNYRPIALTTVMSKIFEILILNCYQGFLVTTDNQFGFKQYHSTDLCVYTFKQVIEYYKRNSSPMYICFLDASKAFDRVNHKMLFSKLLHRNVPYVIVRVLCFWYANQLFYVKWGHVMSASFNVTCGVRQGGILSPVLFNVYIDSLSVKLRSVSSGCYINSVSYNHLIYADDTVLLAPSPKALQTLINVCINFAKDHDLVFNTKKTKFMYIKSDNLRNLFVPTFYIGETVITMVHDETYLGYILNECFTDDDHMMKEMRNLFARGNMLMRNFSHCSEDVKIALFKTFCSNIYCCALWYNFKSCSEKKIHVAGNKVFKALMKVPRDFSASTLFAVCNVRNFPVLRRKLVYSLRSRVYASSNALVNNFLYTNHGLNAMHRYWKSTLYL
jgi:hypothetical protein